MLRGRRLPLPQPALPGWSSKPPPAVIAALASPVSARSFSSTLLRPDSHGNDSSNLFLRLRRQIEAETKAKHQARQEAARQNQQTSGTNAHVAQGAVPAPFKKQSTRSTLVGQRKPSIKSIPDAFQKAASVQPERQSEETAPSSDQIFDTAVQAQGDCHLQHHYDEGRATPNQDETNAKKYHTRQIKSKKSRSGDKSEETEHVAGTNPWLIRRVALANVTQISLASLSSDDRQQRFQDPIFKATHKKSDQNAGEPADLHPPHALLQSEHARALQNPRALAQQLGLGTSGADYTNLKRARSGAKSWILTTTEVKIEASRKAELEREFGSLLSTPLSAPKSVTDTLEDKIEGSISTSDADSSGTVAVKSPGSGLHQQADPPETPIKFRKVPPNPPQQGQPPRGNDATPLENVEQAPLSKAKRSEAGDNSAKSIFTMLFPDGGSEQQKAMSSGLESLSAGVGGGGGGGRESSPRSKADRHMPDFIPKLSRPTESIFAKLFPEEAVLQPEDNEAGEHQEMLSPPENTMFVSLRNEVRNWIPAEEQNEIIAPKPGEYGSHSAVITIWGVSQSLLETDFYRIIPEGKHVEGWAGGLVKIVQAREPLNQKPLGRYYLMFHSRPSAVAYAEEVRRLHVLSQKLLRPSDTGLSPKRGRLNDAPVDPQPFISEEDKAAVRSFTLCSPDTPINLKIEILTTDMIREIAATGVIADVVQGLRSEADTPAKVLVTVTLPGGASPEPGRHGLSTDDLWLTLRDDGRERGVPWSLANLTKGIMPIKMRPGGSTNMRFEAEPIAGQLGLDESEAHDDEDEDLPGTPLGKSTSSSTANHSDKDDVHDGANQDSERYNRFILTFSQRSHAKRFIRCWHKRTINDARIDRHVILDAVALQ